MEKLGRGKGFSFNQVLVLLVLIGIGGWFFLSQSEGPSAQQAVGQEPTVTGAGCEAQQCFQNPTYTYSAVDAFTSSALTGTDRIKINGKAPVTSLANPQKCAELEYWLENTSYFVKPVGVNQVACGANQVEAEGTVNGTISLTAYDQFTQIASATHNVTLGANGLKNIDITWEGEAEKANMPFGGCMVIEYPTTISTITPSGSGLSDSACQYIKTYSVSSTSNTYRSFAVPMGFDADGSGAKKEFALQVRAGSSNPSGSMVVTFYPANYYITDDGDFALGVEKDQNQDTTATFASAVSTTIYIE